MANASAKRIGSGPPLERRFTSNKGLAASQNESTVKVLRLGLFLPTAISLVLRLLLRRSSLPPSRGSIAIYIVTFFPAFFLSNYLIKIGSTRRDPTTGALISYGEDLSQTGVTEWCFDILYITCENIYIASCLLTKQNVGSCQIGSGALGEWFWWLYMVVRTRFSYLQICWRQISCSQIPLYAVFKLWTSVLSPFVFGRTSQASAEGDEKETTSKRQEKLRKRSERGDPRVKAQSSRK